MFASSVHDLLRIDVEPVAVDCVVFVVAEPCSAWMLLASVRSVIWKMSAREIR